MTDPNQPPRHEIQLADIFAALSDPQRLAMVAELHKRGEAVCGTLATDMPKSTRSHHLKVLREAGVTTTEIDGVERHVSLRYDCLNARFPGLLDSILGATALKKARR
ncbi:MAG TPA: metalloregulator ArsR/SmtB family transcription factor [Candidatus Baltobacteraceae bacterium]|jgi:DNA-binding transcriptional ArsR family regulator|nr:metalloregulator ArsR/SmtB family transcription factor [Candidatus Baltobacteraceae bacterium]